MGELVLPIAGLQFYSLSAAGEGLQQGVRLRLQRDPENRHDTHAIRVMLHYRDMVEAEIEPPDELEFDGARTRWMLGHIPEGTSMGTDWAKFLADGMDAAGSPSDRDDVVRAYFSHGTRQGAWSAHVRLEGPAAENALRLAADLILAPEDPYQALAAGRFQRRQQIGELLD